MEDLSAAINAQYGPMSVGESILSAVETSGVDLQALSRTDLDGCSEFHIGGQAATVALAELAGIERGMEVIDIGSGLGGPARTLAAEFGARVTALELSTAYHDAAQLHTELVGINNIDFINGSALDIPASNNSFDAVWMQHCQMNIRDKAKMFSEIRRVLRPGGLFAWHGVLRGANQDPVLYPVPWADTSDISFMTSADEYKGLAASAGLMVHADSWTDMNGASVEFFKRTREKIDRTPTEKRLGINLLLGQSTQMKLTNLLENIRSSRVSVHMAIFKGYGY